MSRFVFGRVKSSLKRGAAYEQNKWLEQNHQSCRCWFVRWISYTVSFVKYSLVLFAKVDQRGWGGAAFSQMKNSPKTPLIIQHLEAI